MFNKDEHWLFQFTYN
uniref:Uncharacterized protein n=1 Tax=Arundo donax TaxID=35708 RepID=A0A0A8YHN6_ARUDO